MIYIGINLKAAIRNRLTFARVFCIKIRLTVDESEGVGVLPRI